jgi:hypothetical protein
MMEMVNRRAAIKICSAYRTVPTDAILAIARVSPIQLKVRETCCTYEQGAEAKTEAREELLEAWQQYWRRYDGWVKVFIPDINISGIRGHGEKWTTT